MQLTNFTDSAWRKPLNAQCTGADPGDASSPPVILHTVFESYLVRHIKIRGKSLNKIY